MDSSGNNQHPKIWETLSSEVLQKNPWTQFIHETYRLPTGNVGDYFYLQTPVGSVTIVPVLPNGNILLHKQHRYLFQKESLSFPAGGIKEGCTSIQAAHMELEEETGYQAGHVQQLTQVAPCIGLLKELMTSFVAWDLTVGAAKPDESEQFELVELSVEEVDQAIMSGEIWDAFAVIAWHLARPKVVEYLEKH